tara:strand:- start:881 stop:1009 length:129 start_codon:yes stop_codon:yes gene_type:complete
MASIPKYVDSAESNISNEDFTSDESYYDEVEDLNAFPINDNE